MPWALAAHTLITMDNDPSPSPERALARFRFYEELNDFLPPALRKRDIEYRCALPPQ